MNPNYRINGALIKKINDMKKEGYSDYTIASHCNMTISNLKNTLNHYNLSPKLKKNKNGTSKMSLIPNLILKYIIKKNKRVTGREIAIHTKLSYNSVNYHLTILNRSRYINLIKIKGRVFYYKK